MFHTPAHKQTNPAAKPGQVIPAQPGECQRTLAIYRPGVPMGTNHHFAWTGRIPCTGTLVCRSCGERG